MENNVSLPVLFCLVSGKERQTYIKLLDMVDELAAEAGLVIFNREALLMCDFELAFINVVQQRFPLVSVKCCFFHFTQSIRRKATDVITAVSKAAGKNSAKVHMAMRAVRRLMMLPLVPEELITPELVELIIAASTDSRSELLREVKAFQAYVLTTYVGKRRARSGPVLPPRFPLALWNVSAMATRTNNAAESVHAQMNADVKGVLMVHGFLHIIEEQMERTNERIAAGCKPETKAVEAVKNQLLAVELHKLLDGRQGIMNFLDNCGSVVQLKNKKEASAFVPQAIAPFEDIEWKPANRELVAAAAQGLHLRINPESQLVGDDVLKRVPQWAFQVPPDPEVHVPPSQTRLSLVDNRPRMVFEAIRERIEKEGCQHDDEETQEDDEEDYSPFLRRAPFSVRPEDIEEARRRIAQEERRERRS